MNSRFYLTHLYPQHMSIYGDMGNIIALCYKLEKLGFEIVYQQVELGTEFPKKTDLYFMGGGQDKEQYIIYKDLLTRSEQLKADIENNIPILAICGGYQLLGKQFITGDGVEIDGIGIFPVITKALDTSVKSRCIGNIIVQTELPGLQQKLLLGFENHSGQTYFIDELDENSARPLGKVLVGFGNNHNEKIEGCVYKNAVGTYLHGSCLPKNPELTNYLIRKALEVKITMGDFYTGFDLNEFLSKITVAKKDKIALAAKQSLIRRFAPELVVIDN